MASTSIYKSINPYTNKVLTSIPYTSLSSCLDICKTLKTDGKVAQSKLSPFERSDILARAANLLVANKEELSKLVTSEVGKTINDSVIEVDRGYNTFISCSEEARNSFDGIIQNSDTFGPKKNKDIFIKYRPLGTVFCVAPFNFPVNLLLHKIGPAFAAGNCIFVKPHAQGYLTAKKIIDICYEAGMPKSVIQLALPDNETVLQVASSDLVDCVNLTGSVNAGKQIGKAAGFKKQLFELGGNDACIVFEDANIDLAVNQAMERYGYAGQRCIAPKRVYVQRSIYNQFRDKVVARTKALRYGDPTLTSTDIGPVISSYSADAVMKRLEDSIAAGARVLVGGKREGNVIQPTVVENVPDNQMLVAEETFGPILPLRPFDTIEEVIKLANESPYGLQSGVYTNSIETAKRMIEAIDAGSVGINAGPCFRIETMPFGGVKNSGIGREGVKYAIKEMQCIKSYVL